MGYFMKIT